MLQVVISPAKQMRTAQDAFDVLGIPPFAHQTARLHQALLGIEREDGAAGLQALWNVSDRLLTTCLDTLHEFMPALSDADLADPDIARRISPAVMSYHGIQYQSMAPEVMDAAQLDWLQNHLWILSGLYGCVRPFHGVEPIGSKWEPSSPSTTPVTSMRFGATNLHAPLRRPAPTPRSSTLPARSTPRPFYPISQATPQPSLVSLAKVSATGKPIQRSTASKKARGSMVRWMAENKLEDAAGLTEFNIGYRHAPEISYPGTLVFINEQML